MVTAIAIENFRCFKKFKVDGLKPVTLIGGKNNVGKTVLLEALWLACSPTKATIEQMAELRQEFPENYKDFPEHVWDNLFLNRETGNLISLSYVVEDLDNKVNIAFVWDDKATLSFSGQEGTFLTLSFDGKDKWVTAGKVRGRGAKQAVEYISAIEKASGPSVARSYEKATVTAKDDLVLNALKIIDEGIVSARISILGGTRLELKRDGHYLPVSMFGDAVTKVLNIVLKVVTSGAAIILIDEVENGLHHSVHAEFWRMLFGLAQKFNVQIVATSHSAEMIKAFNQVAESHAEGMSTYVELRRNGRTGNIVASTYDAELLEYRIQADKSYRGE